MATYRPHENIERLLNRMEADLVRRDYPAVVHASACVFETLAKEIVGLPTVQKQTLRSFFDRYREDTKLSNELLNLMLSIYDLRNTTPTAGHGGLETPAISRREAILIAELTPVIVKLEYDLQASDSDEFGSAAPEAQTAAEQVARAEEIFVRLTPAPHPLQPLTLKREFHREPHSAYALNVVFSPDGRSFVTTGGDSNVIMWDVDNGVEVRRYTEPIGVNSVAYSPDGLTLAIGKPRRIQAWSVPTRVQQWERWIPDGAELNSLAYTPDGRYLLAGGTTHVRLLDALTGEEIAQFPPDTSRAFSIAVHPLGQLAALACSDVHLWDLEKRHSLKRIGSDDTFLSLAFNPSGTELAMGGRDGSIWLWDVRKQELSRSLAGRRRGVTALAYHPDERLLASGGADATCRLWDTWVGLEIQQVGEYQYGVNDLAFSPDGRLLAVASTTPQVELWRLLAKEHHVDS